MSSNFKGWEGFKYVSPAPQRVRSNPIIEEINAMVTPEGLAKTEKRMMRELKKPTKEQPAAKTQTPQQRTQTLGRLPGGEMNKTEAAYNRLLEKRLGLGDIRWFKFEPINIRLGPKCFYRVDFMVMNFDGVIEAHEVKGFWAEDALVKFKVAAATLPFKFIAVRMVKGSFETILEI